jgi:hypothetical protein
VEGRGGKHRLVGRQDAPVPAELGRRADRAAAARGGDLA